MQVVAIGASAGGIEAFRAFFNAMPADNGMGFVVVLHMSADRKSLLPEIIARWTAMAVTEAEDGGRVAPNQIYVIPPGHVSLRSGFLTSAAETGASVFKMMDTSRHKSVDMLRLYVRRADLCKEHAGSAFL